MPYSIARTGPDLLTVALWPHRSLPRRGFVIFIAATAVLLALPLLTMLGSPVLWGLLPFMALALGGVYAALTRNYRDTEIVETLTLRAGQIDLVRTGPRGRRQAWAANPYWVRVALHPTGGPVPNYLTLQGGPREVELGAFLSEDERLALRDTVAEALQGLK